MSQNVVLEKSAKFALRIVRLYQYLTDEKKEFILSKQILTSGTYIGADVKSAQEAESKANFTHEMQTALQHTSRTEYWLKLLHDAGLLEAKLHASLDADREELKKLLTSIIKSAKGQPRN